MPVVDYEDSGIEAIEPEYAKIRPPFARTYSPPAANGLNVGRQLVWQRARSIPSLTRARNICCSIRNIGRGG